MNDITDPLSEACADCGQPIGGHTVREWSSHVSTPSLDLPCEEIPGGPIPTEFPRLMADHVIAEACVIDHVAVSDIGAVRFTFGVGSLDHPPENYESLMFVGSAETLRKTGKLLRDICNQAANRINRKNR